MGSQNLLRTGSNKGGCLGPISDNFPRQGMELMIFKVLLVVFSSAATLLSLVFMLSPRLFSEIEEFLGMEMGQGAYITILEGKINFLNDWVVNNRMVFGPLFAVLAALNTRNAFFF